MAVSDLFEPGLKNEDLVLLHEANKQVNIAANTPSGISERGYLGASVEVDTIVQACLDACYGYKYKDSVGDDG